MLSIFKIIKQLLTLPLYRIQNACKRYHTTGDGYLRVVTARYTDAEFCNHPTINMFMIDAYYPFRTRLKLHNSWAGWLRPAYKYLLVPGVRAPRYYLRRLLIPVETNVVFRFLRDVYTTDRMKYLFSSRTHTCTAGTRADFDNIYIIQIPPETRYELTRALPFE